MSDDARHLLLPVLRYYLPQEITKSLQSTSTGFYIPGIRAKLYQRADGSADDVFNFYSFPGSATKFEMGMTVPYNMNTYVYTGMTHSDRTFAYKHDLLIYLEQVVSHIVRHNTLFMSLISFYLKSKERELGNGNFELALVDRDIFRQVCAKFEEAMGRLREKGEDMYSKKLPEISHEQFCGRMADFLKSRHDQDIKPMMDVFKKYEKTNSFTGMFKPSSISKPIDEPDIIRCFEDDRKFLIMDYEFVLAKAQNRKVSDYEEKNIKEVKEKIKRTGVYGTVLCNKSTKKTDNVEYTNIPHGFNNLLVVAVTCLLYASFCCVLGEKVREIEGPTKNSSLSTQIFFQSALICAVNQVASVIYVIMNFIEVPLWLIMLGHMLWQTGHGAPVFIYLGLNKTIRTGVLKRLGIKTEAMSGSVVPAV